MTTSKQPGRPNKGYGKGRVLRSVPWTPDEYAVVVEAAWQSRQPLAVLIRTAALAQARKILKRKTEAA